MEHKFKLGQRVRIISYGGDSSSSMVGKNATIIGILLKSRDYYSAEYTIVVEGECQKRYARTEYKFKKHHLDERDLVALKVVRAYCFSQGDTLFWSTNDASLDRADRHPEFDFEKTIEEEG